MNDKRTNPARQAACSGPEKMPDQEQASDREPFDDEADYQQIASWAKALGHPARVRIVSFLLSQDACVCGEIVAHGNLAQSTVSQHLKILKAAGIIQGSIAGASICYCVNPQVLAAFSSALAGLQAQQKNPRFDCCDC